jgi:hypothetical protein
MLLLSLINLLSASLLLWLILHIFQIKQFKWCVTNVWTIMHLDPHILEFEFLDYDNVKPLKSKFSINSYLASKTFFLIWYESALHVFNSLKRAPNPFKMQHINEISKLIFLTYFQFTFSQHDQLANFAK